MKKYKTIYVDPPWMERGYGKFGRAGADSHYPLMKTKRIMEMKDFIDEIASKNCHLYLWATNNHLKSAFEVIQAWEFIYITIITWFKKGGAGLGLYYKGKTEHCIFARRGILPYKVKGGIQQCGKTGFIAERKGHSIKPEEMRKMIEKVSYYPRIELFAREKHKGWDVWGNEIESDVNYRIS